MNIIDIKKHYFKRKAELSTKGLTPADVSNELEMIWVLLCILEKIRNAPSVFAIISPNQDVEVVLVDWIDEILKADNI